MIPYSQPWEEGNTPWRWEKSLLLPPRLPPGIPAGIQRNFPVGFPSSQRDPSLRNAQGWIRDVLSPNPALETLPALPPAIPTPGTIPALSSPVFFVSFPPGFSQIIPALPLGIPIPQLWAETKERDPPEPDPFSRSISHSHGNVFSHTPRKEIPNFPNPKIPQSGIPKFQDPEIPRSRNSTIPKFRLPFSSTALLRSVSHSTSSHFQPGGHSISSLGRTFSPFCGTQGILSQTDPEISAGIPARHSQNSQFSLTTSV